MIALYFALAWLAAGALMTAVTLWRQRTTKTRKERKS